VSSENESAAATDAPMWARPETSDTSSEGAGGD